MFTKHMKLMIGAVAIPCLIAGCGSGESNDSTDGNQQTDGPTFTEGASFQIFENDTCVASNTRVLVNDQNGRLIGDLRTDSEGYISTESMPINGSIGIVFSYRVGVPGVPEFTTVSHIDTKILQGTEALTILSPLIRCVDDYDIQELLTIRASNAGDFDAVAFKGLGSSGYDQFDPDSGKVIGLGFNEGDAVKYGLASTDVTPGSAVTIDLIKDVREVTWQASTTPPGNIALIWANGDTYSVISSAVPMGAVTGMLPMLSEPGKMLARATYTNNDPFAKTVYWVTEQIAANALTESNIEFSGVAPSDVTITGSNQTQLTYNYTGRSVIELVEATQFAPSIQRSYSTDSNLGYVNFPDLPTDLDSQLANMEEVKLSLNTLDPTIYPPLFGTVMPRTQKATLVPPHVDHVLYQLSLSLID